MIVDVHTHCLQPEHVSWEARQADERAGYPPMQSLSPQRYLEALEPVDRAIVFGVRALRTGLSTPNEYTARWVAHDPTKLVGFMGIDPCEEGYIAEVDRCVSELGLRGIKLYPALAGFDPSDRTIWPLYEKAQQMGLPILLHMGAHPDPRARLEYSQPLLIDRVAQAFPALKFVIAHMGHPWQRECAVVVRKHPNVYTDISGVWVRPWQGWQALVTMVEWEVQGKLLFGSDFPLWTPHEALTELRGLNDQLEGTKLPRVAEEVLEAVIHRDSLGLLGLA